MPPPLIPNSRELLRLIRIGGEYGGNAIFLFKKLPKSFFFVLQKWKFGEFADLKNDLGSPLLNLIS